MPLLLTAFLNLQLHRNEDEHEHLIEKNKSVRHNILAPCMTHFIQPICSVVSDSDTLVHHQQRDWNFLGPFDNTTHGCLRTALWPGPTTPFILGLRNEHAHAATRYTGSSSTLCARLPSKTNRKGLRWKAGHRAAKQPHHLRKHTSVPLGSHHTWA